MAWQSTTEQIKGKNDFLYSLMNSYMPKKSKENRITLVLDSELQKTEFAKNQDEVLLLLREELENDYLLIDYEIETQFTEKKFTYTTAEEFDILKEKNPYLEELRKRFSFDFID